MKRILTVFCIAVLGFRGWSSDAGGGADAESVRFDFDKREEFSKAWEFYTHNPLLKKTTFRIERRPSSSDGFVLVVNADSSSGFICTAPKFDLTKFPVMRWRWRIINNLNVPKGAEDPDDQSGVVYIGDGNRIKQCFVAYRWECNSLIGSWMHTHYRSGLTSVKSVCLRNRATKVGEWVVDERNVLEDFNASFKRPPADGFVLCVGANTQHSKSSTRIEIDYIEFLPPAAPGK